MKYRKFLVFLMIALIIPINASAKTLGDLKNEYNALEQAYIDKQNEINLLILSFFILNKITIPPSRVDIPAIVDINNALNVFNVNSPIKILCKMKLTYLFY